MGRFIRSLIIAFAFLGTVLVSGCAATPPVFKARVTTFANWPDTVDASQMTYTFAHPEKQEVSLEQQAYEDMVREQLYHIGLTPAPSADNARYLVYLFIWSGERERQVSAPVYTTPPGPFLSPGFRNPHTGYWYGPHWVYPYGFGPQYAGERQVTQNYLHARLTLIIRDRQALSPQGTPRPVYETTAITKSTRLGLVELVPLMARAALDNFPAENGSDRIIRIELPTQGQ